MKTVITILLIVLAPLSATDPPAKSEQKANSLIISSALVPGFGELKLGENRRAKFFGGIELGLWLTVIESNAVMHRSRSKMVSYAAVHAGADLDGKEHQFAVDVANYMSFDEFNEEQQRRRLPSGFTRRKVTTGCGPVKTIGSITGPFFAAVHWRKKLLSLP